MSAKAAAPWATALIVALTVAAYAWTATRTDAEFMAFLEAGAIRADAPRATAFLSYAALHGSLLHLAINVALVAAFGPGVERRGRAWGLLGIYLLSAVAGAVAHVAFAPAALRPMLVGASGAVSGVMGAHAAMLPAKRVALGAAVLWGLLNVAGLLIDREGSRGISYSAHLGGLALGAALGAVLGKLVKAPR